MEQAIQAGGSTIRDLMAPDGKAGSYQDQRLVYGRGGDPCPTCKTPSWPPAPRLRDLDR
jgi:formamidopyrimidine-DNA glycosylase